MSGDGGDGSLPVALALFYYVRVIGETYTHDAKVVMRGAAWGMLAGRGTLWASRIHSG